MPIATESARFVPQIHVKDHLRIIGAFVALTTPPPKHDPGHLAPHNILNIAYLAVHRLELWLEKVIGRSYDHPEIPQRQLPPLDVAMALHAYMLSPLQFREDSIYRLPQLSFIHEFPFKALSAMIDMKTFSLDYSPEQASFWEERTGLPFDPIDNLRSNWDASIVCPNCEAVTTIPWLAGSRAFFDDHFSHPCDLCHAPVTRERLCIKKFLDALSLTNVGGLPGTLLDDQGNKMPSYATQKTMKLRVLLHNTRVGKESLSDLRDKITRACIPGLDVDSIMNAISCPGPFSLDLPSMILHLLPFHKNLYDAQWCTKSFLSGPCPELSTAYSRYREFLELSAPPNQTSIVPTIDADLIWHTHQLMPVKYRADVTALLGFFLHHLAIPESKVQVSIIASDQRRMVYFGPGCDTTYSSSSCGGSTAKRAKVSRATTGTASNVDMALELANALPTGKSEISIITPNIQEVKVYLDATAKSFQDTALNGAADNLNSAAQHLESALAQLPKEHRSRRLLTDAKDMFCEAVNVVREVAKGTRSDGGLIVAAGMIMAAGGHILRVVGEEFPQAPQT